MGDHQERVTRFMLRAGQEVPSKISIPSEEVRRLRAKLILEEAEETIIALGYNIYEGEDGELHVRRHPYLQPNLVEIIDGVADLSVVNIGTSIACGVDIRPILKAVDQNNLDKFGPGHSIREDGKLVKPPNHTPPDIKRLLEEQGWET